MNSQVSSIGWDLKFDGLEISSRSELPAVLDQLSSQIFVLRISKISLSEILAWLSKLKNDQQPILIIHLDQRYETSELNKIINSGFVHKVIEGDLDQQDLFDPIRSGLVELRNNQQNKDLIRLVKEQNEKLKLLYHELESRVTKRQTELNQSRLKKQTTNRREQALKESLIAIFKSKSLGDLEIHLSEVLKEFMTIELVRIYLDPNEQHLNLNQVSDQLVSANVPLFSGHNPMGQIYFFRNSQIGFSRNDFDFLSKLAEAVGLALHRISTLQEAETINLQWNATFDAISDPLVIISKDFEILQTNKAADAIAEQYSSDSKKCYQLLFQRSTPCLGCRMGTDFRIKEEKKSLTYEVSSHLLPSNSENELVSYVHLYRDVTDQLKIEKQILESSKLMELGTIGSSIAHELNNPIGGILNFAQLIKMDIQSDDPLYDDVCAIEEGAKKCKDIVQNLLTFARNPDSDQIVNADLIEIITRSTKIIELKTKSKGVSIDLQLPKGPLLIKGHINLLTQAMQNILQNSIESIEIKQKNKSSKKEKYSGKISISILLEDKKYFVIQIIDNGVGISQTILDQVKDPLFTTKDQNFNPGLGLTIADRILQDHDGSLEIQSIEEFSTTVTLQIPRLVLS